ncbi:MAG TPA: hypothetical protein PLL57_13200, partial [Flavobacteriales bacterium]|nr:hypothetical protein [Flavobacteriales bacterium]
MLVLVAFLVRAGYAACVISAALELGMSGREAVVTDDTRSYLDPIESVLNGGGYSPDYRMPGVGA